MEWNLKSHVNRVASLFDASFKVFSVSHSLICLDVHLFFFIPGTSGVLLRKVNGTAIVQLPSKRQVQVRSSALRFVIKKPPAPPFSFF